MSGISDKTKERLTRIASAMDVIPEEEQEKLTFGIEMLAAYESNKKPEQQTA